MPEPIYKRNRSSSRSSTPPRRRTPEGRARSPIIFRPSQNQGYDIIRRQSSRSPLPNEIRNNFRGNNRQHQSPPRQQNIELHLVQRAWRGRSSSSSSDSSRSSPPPRIYGNRQTTPPQVLTPPPPLHQQDPLDQLHRELDEVQNQLNRVVQRINEHQRPAAAQQRRPQSRSGSPILIEAAQDPKPMKFFILLQREVKFEFVAPTDFIWTEAYERRFSRIIINMTELNPRKPPIWIYNRSYQRMQTFINANEVCQLSYNRFVEENGHDQRPLVTMLQSTDL
jgi:hypothetical protein